MLIVGLIVNPVAGVGGPKGLKGSDGGLASRAMAAGAVPLAGVRGAEALTSVIGMAMEEGFEKPRILSCSGRMGGEAISAADYGNFEIVYDSPAETTARDSAEAARMMIGKGAEMILFVGGDGTARDIAEAVGKEFPLLGIPAGVKMYTAIFLNRPGDLGGAVRELTLNGIRTRKVELLDFDRQPDDGPIGVKSYGTASVPVLECTQQGKSEHPSSQEELEGIGDYVIEKMSDSAYYVFGTGHTVKSILRKMGYSTPVLGVDILHEKKLIGRDLDDTAVASLLAGVDDENIIVIVTPLGGNGFLFGRGNQQISSTLLSRIGRENVMVVATTEKMNSLGRLKVDTGDSEQDRRLKGVIEIITGYSTRRIGEIE